MEPDAVNVASQARLSALLQYFQRGDFARFSKICSLAFGSVATTERYFCANLLLAAQLCGLCETSTSTGAIKWWVAHTGDIEIRSRKPKRIPLSPSSARADDQPIVALVTDAQRRPLVLGMREDPDDHNETAPELFGTALDHLIRPFKDIEQQLFSPERFSDALAGHVEMYCPDAGRWDAVELQAILGPALLRVRREFSGVAYFVQHSALRLRFRVTQPEWAFVVAYQLLPWRVRDVLQIDGSSVSLHRAVRLPALLSRLLLSGADAVRMGPMVRYEGVDMNTIKGVLRYLDKHGARQ